LKRWITPALSVHYVAYTGHLDVLQYIPGCWQCYAIFMLVRGDFFIGWLKNGDIDFADHYGHLLVVIEGFHATISWKALVKENSAVSWTIPAYGLHGRMPAWMKLSPIRQR
jgi:hypothetical protein